MKKTICKLIPQGGTSCSAAGESATIPSGSSSPPYSGGGNKRLPLAIGNESRGGSSRSRSFDDLISFNFKLPDQEPGECRAADAVSVSPQAVAAAPSKFWGKRPRACELDACSAGLSSSEENLPAPKVTTAKRGRGRGQPSGSSTSAASSRNSRGRFLKCPDTPEASGVSDSDGAMQVEQSATSTALVSTKAELNAARREGRKVVATDEVAEMARQARERRVQTAVAPEGLTAEALSRQVLDGVDVVLKVATKSGNLKGTFTRALKEAADGIKEAMDVLLDRTTSEETVKLQEENYRLQTRMEELQREVSALRADFNRQQGATTTESRALSKDGSLGEDQFNRLLNIMTARLDSIEPRLNPPVNFRPPLAADKRRRDVDPASPTDPTWAQVAKTPVAPAPKKPSQVGKTPSQAAKTHSQVARRPSQAAKRPTEGAKNPKEGAPMQENDQATNEGAWKTAEGRKKRRKRGRKAKNAPGSKGQAPRIRVPRSEAVVITLQPEAKERGVTYQKVLAEARGKLVLADFGTPEGFRFKTAATGAKMFELAGTNSAERADSLAAKLRDVLNPEEARVSRPIKTAEVRVDGLDDSVTPEEVVAAIARSGGCPSENVRAGDIRVNARGLGTIWVRCPVAAAKKIAEVGRLLVGWVAAGVKLLAPRAMQCYRCLEKGHVRALCTGCDRSDLCYRCGQPGHKASLCSAEPNCSLCAAAGKSAGHRIGGNACGAPRKRSKRWTKPAGAAAPSTSLADSRPEVGRNAKEMECQ